MASHVRRSRDGERVITRREAYPPREESCVSCTRPRFLDSLEYDADAVASGISDRLFGLVADAIVPQAATRRPEGGEVGILGKPFL